MLTNGQMIENRYANFHRYRKFVANVRAAVAAGHTVNIQAGFKIMPFKAKNIDCIEAKRSGVYVQCGKRRVCIMDRAVSPSRVWAQ